MAWYAVVQYRPILNHRPMRSFLTNTSFALLLVAASPSASLLAQSSGNAVGLKAGVNWSNLRADGADVNDENARFGFHGGLFGRVAAAEHLGVQAELLYSTKGTKVVYNGLIDQETTFNLSYLELPVFVVVGLGDAFELHLGGYAGYLLASDVTTEGDLGSGSEDLDRDNFQDLDFGLLGGIGVNVGPAQIGARYTYGLTKLGASDAADLLLGDAKNSVAQVYIAFGLGKD